MYRDDIVNVSVSNATVAHIWALDRAGLSVGRIAHIYGFDGNDRGMFVVRLLEWGGRETGILQA